MAKILIPVDFTEVSVHALRFAFDYKNEGDELHLIHVQTGLLSDTNVSSVMNLETTAEAIKNKLLAFIMDNIQRSLDSVKFEIEVLFGEIVSSIVSYSEAHSPDIIFMGTRDKYDLINKWLGTVSLGVIKRTSKPVFLVPKSATYSAFKKVLVAGDQHLQSERNLNYLKEWNTSYNAHLHILHIENSPGLRFDKTEEKIIKKYFEESEVPFSFEIEKKPGNEVGHLLLEEAFINQVDLMIIFPEKQSFLSALFLQSTTKILVLNSKTPMLFVK